MIRKSQTTERIENNTPSYSRAMRLVAKIALNDPNPASRIMAAQALVHLAQGGRVQIQYGDILDTCGIFGEKNGFVRREP